MWVYQRVTCMEHVCNVTYMEHLCNMYVNNVAPPVLLDRYRMVPTFPLSRFHRVALGDRWHFAAIGMNQDPNYGSLPVVCLLTPFFLGHILYVYIYVYVYIYMYVYIYVCIVCIYIYIYITWLSWFSAHFYLGEIPRLKSVMLNSHLLSANQTWFEWKSSILDDFPTQTCMEFGDVQMVYSCIHVSVYSRIFPLYPIYPHYIPSGLS